jgi:hypothetical protein
MQSKSDGKNRETHANADTRISSFNFADWTVSLGGREVYTSVPKASPFLLAWDQIPVRAITMIGHK